MWFSLFSLVLILCIAFFQALQGLFSAVIMCVITILSAALAFGTYESLYYGPLIGQIPDHGEAVALFGIFIITLIVLRTLFDNVIKGNMQFPVWVDRIGGGTLGLVSAIIIIGMLQLGFELLPFSSEFLGFNRFVPVSKDRRAELAESDLKKKGPDDMEWQRKHLWLFSPDERVVSLVSLLSDGALSGSTRFSDVHPDFAAGVQNSRSGVQRESRHALAAVDALTVDTKGYWVLPMGRLVRPVTQTDKSGNDQVVEKATVEKPGCEWRVYHVLLADVAADSDQRVRFKPSQVRIVGRDRPGGPASEYILKGMARDAGTSKFAELFRDPVFAKAEWTDVIRGVKTKLPLDFVFEVPKTFQADFLEFKRTSRADVSMVRAKPEKELVETASTPKPKPKEKTEKPTPDSLLPGPSSSGGSPSTPGSDNLTKGRVLGVELSDTPRFIKEAPFPLKQTTYSLTNGEPPRSGKLVGGHIIAAIKEETTPDESKRIKAFDVPEDQRLLYVPVKELDPKSTYGQAMDYAHRATPSVRLKTSDNLDHRPVGKYAIAKIDGQQWFECWYLDADGRTADSPIPIFDKLHHDQLVQDGTTYVYLFMLPPGAKPKALLRGNHSDDIASFNLEAPK